jgi:hypothetical protein
MLGLFLGLPGASVVWRVGAAVVEFLLSCKPCLIALAIGAAWVAGDVHGSRHESAVWSAKWKAAEAKAEHDRQTRDAFVKAAMEKNANDRVAGISARAAELEKKVEAYEQDEELRRATGNGAAAVDSCVTDQSDDRWLRDIEKRRTRPRAIPRGSIAGRLRSYFAGSPDPAKRRPEGEAPNPARP